MPHNAVLITLGYDEIISSPESVSSCSYCLQSNEVEALLGLLGSLAWRTRWYSTSNQAIDPDLIEAFSDGLRSKLMSGCCGDELQLAQFTSDGVYEVSYDNGQTWVDRPDLDPRNGIRLPPALTSEEGVDRRCEAANHTVGYYQNYVETVAKAKDAEAGYSDIAAVFIGLLLILGFVTVGWAYLLIGGLIALIYANYDATAWRAAFTDTVWENLYKALYCNMEDDGSFTDAGFALVLLGIDDTITGIAQEFLHRMIENLRPPGLLSTGRQTDFNADLDCPPSCGTCDLSHWQPYSEAHGTVTIVDDTHIDLEGALIEGFGYYAIAVTPANDDCCFVVSTSTISGSVTGGDFCNTCNNDVNLASPEATILNKCVRMIEYVSVNPFVVRVELSACP